MAGMPGFGFMGVASQTAATRHLHARALGMVRRFSGGRRRRKKAATRAPRRMKAKRTRRGRARLVKGSTAARAYMRKIRGMRKRK